MCFKQCVSSLLTIVLPGSALMAHEGDVGIRLSGGRLETVLASGEPPMQTLGTEIERVFAAELEFNTTTNTVVIDEPGLASDETALGGQSLGFNIRKALRQWNGAEFVSTTSTMSAGGGDLGLDFISTPATDVLAAGHTIIVPAAPFDFHYDWRLDGATALAGTGVYLVELELTNPMGSFMTSDPFWVVFNYGEDEMVHDAAVDWTVENLVPVPGAGGLILIGMAAVVRRRRR
jgi:hypothetical protein